MLYIVLGKDADDSLEARRSSREAHLERVEALLHEGRLELAGPMPAIDASDPGPAGYSGSVIIAEFDSLDDAQQWADLDPYVASGAWVSVVAKPFIKAKP
ncbi:MAG: YciI family protein [Pseudomonadota bacterium]